MAEYNIEAEKYGKNQNKTKLWKAWAVLTFWWNFLKIFEALVHFTATTDNSWTDILRLCLYQELSSVLR